MTLFIPNDMEIRVDMLYRAQLKIKQLNMFLENQIAVKP